MKIFRAVASTEKNPSAVDRRGTCFSRKAKHEDTQFIKDFVKRLPKYESHYNKIQSTKKYLHPSWNIKKLHTQYQAFCLKEKRNAMSLSYFRKVFKRIGVIFPKLRTDNDCSKCKDLKSKLKRSVISQDARAKLENDRKQHLSLASKVVDEYIGAVERAQETFENTEIITFGMGTPIDLPSIASTDLTKRRLFLHEFCCFDEQRQMSYVYLWPESVAAKGTQETVSCISQHLHAHLPHETKRLILYCDPYLNQNHNIKLSLFLQKFLDSWPHTQLKSIEQKFFVEGHGFNSCDRCFGTIKKRKPGGFLPSHIVHAINEPKGKQIIYASELREENFSSTKPLENLLANNEIAANGHKINWLSFESIIYHRDKPFVLNVTHFDGSVDNVRLMKRNESDKFSDTNLTQLHPNGRYISKLKYDDLKEFFKLIPNQYQDFFDSLEYIDSNDEKDYAFCMREGDEEDI